MINTNMREYDYYTYGDENAYGQNILSSDPTGKIKIAIFVTSQAVQDNILYKDCTYIGLTMDRAVNDTYVIQYGDEKLKVLYVQPGRLNQVFLKRV